MLPMGSEKPGAGSSRRAVVLGLPPRLGLPNSGSVAHALINAPRPTTSAQMRANSAGGQLPLSAALPIVCRCIVTLKAVLPSPAASRSTVMTVSSRFAPKPPNSTGTTIRGTSVPRMASKLA